MRRYTIKDNIVSGLIGALGGLFLACVSIQYQESRVLQTTDPTPTVAQTATVAPTSTPTPLPTLTPTPIIEEPEIEKEVVPEVNPTPVLISLGEFKITAYCGCEECCGIYGVNRPIDENGDEIVYGSIGKRLEVGRSIAVDPKVIPYGTKVMFNGHEYVAEDCGGAIKGNRIDLYMEDHAETVIWGVQNIEVFLVQVNEEAK